MKPSSFPVLHNRPIDQWKVTELKEELKRRKLTIKGLKEDLVKRLDEALRDEMKTANEEEVYSENDNDSQHKGQDNADETTLVANDTVCEADKPEEGVERIPKDAEDQADGRNIEVADALAEAGDDDRVKIPDKSSGRVAEKSCHVSPATKDELVTDTPSLVTCNAAAENASSETALAIQGSENEQIGKENSDSRTQLDPEDIKPPDEEVKHVMSDLNNQVSEVSPSLGFPIKSDSISADSMSIDEKNELKDNIIADDVKLEPDVKHEIVQPSSSPGIPDSGISHPMGVEESRSKVLVDETNNTVIDVDMSKKNSSADLGSPEKLNLDRSSGDDSMEEDTLESKQVDSTYNSDEVGGRNEKTDVTMPKEESCVGVVGGVVSNDKKDSHEEDMVAVVSTDKRKLPDQETLAKNEPSKRQRRLKNESVKVSEPQSSSPPLCMTPRGTSQAFGLKHSVSRSNSIPGDDSPKERVVPPPLKPPTDSLRIDNFVRPFTLKAVQELLGKTGTVTSLWMDHIKTHCYVTYSSVEEATETRNALYNLQWPPNGGRLLAVEFVDAEEVKSHVDGPPQPPAVAPPAASVAPPLQPSPLQLGPRQKQPLQTNLPPPPPLTNPPARERLHPPLPPPPEIVEPPAVTLDDLFRKTKVTPRIYYLPLSEEQARAKLEAQRRNSKQ